MRGTPAPSLYPYERHELRQILGPTLRPGGLVLTERALAHCGLHPGDRVLDVGCGPGGTVAHLTRKGLGTMGIDPSLKLLRNPVSNLGFPRVNGRAEELPFASEAFHAVFCECVLSLVRSRERSLDEILRVLKPGGHMVWTDIYRRGPQLPDREPGVAPANCLQGAVSLGSGRKMLHSRGCRELLCEKHDHLLAEAAARLVFAGIDPSELFPCDNGCGGGAGNNTIGYFLIIARKGGEG